MPPKRHYEVGESSKPRAMTEEAKRRRQAYLEMWRNVRNPRNEELRDPIPPQTPEESHPATAPTLSSPKQLQDPDDKLRSNTEGGYLVTSLGEKVQFKWGRCIGTGPDPEEEEEEEEDPEEGDLEEDPKEVYMGEQQGDTEESEEDPEENFEGAAEGELEEEEEAANIEENAEDEQEPMESSEDEEPWEIPSDEDAILDEDDDEGNEDEPVAIERVPDEWEFSDSEYKGFPSDDEL